MTQLVPHTIDLINGDLFDKEEWNVTFDYNDGLTTDVIIQVENLKNVSKPVAPELEGYTFLYWHVDNEIWVFSGFLVTEDITLIAAYAPKHYEVTFVNTVEDQQFENETVTYDENLVLPIIEDYIGYDFLGWFTDADVQYFDGIWETDSNLTLYAKFEINGEVNPVLVLNELPEEEIAITFWHIYGQEKSALLDEFISYTPAKNKG